MTRKSASTSPPTTSSQRPSPTTTPSEHTETEEGWKWQLPANIPYASFDPLDTPRPWHITSLALAQQRQASKQHPSPLPSAQTKTHLPSQPSGNTTPRSQPRSTTSSPLLPPSIRQQQKRPHEDPHYPLTHSPRPSSNHRHHHHHNSSPSSSTSPPPPTAAHPSYNAALTSDNNPTKISMQYYQATRQVKEYRLMFRVEERDGEVQRWKRRVIEVS